MLVQTDAGPAVVKVLQNPAGPDALVRELVGTRLAAAFGLPTFDFAVLHYDGLVPLFLSNGEPVQPGMAFATRFERGNVWGGTSVELKRLSNPDDIARMIVFDHWIQNFDRFTVLGGSNRGNVFHSTERSDAAGQLCLLAIDHTHCLLERSPFADHIAGGHVTDPTEYTVFRSYTEFVDAASIRRSADALESLPSERIVESCENIPEAWTGGHAL